MKPAQTSLAALADRFDAALKGPRCTGSADSVLIDLHFAAARVGGALAEAQRYIDRGGTLPAGSLHAIERVLKAIRTAEYAVADIKAPQA